MAYITPTHVGGLRDFMHPWSDSEDLGHPRRSHGLVHLEWTQLKDVQPKKDLEKKFLSRLSTIFFYPSPLSSVTKFICICFFSTLAWWGIFTCFVTALSSIIKFKLNPLLSRFLLKNIGWWNSHSMRHRGYISITWSSHSLCMVLLMFFSWQAAAASCCAPSDWL